jgi:hypothetical protein
MHEFDRRLNQLLDCVADLTAARRQRLARSLRQDDVELGVRVAEPTLDAAMKAALRVAAHEVLDVFCMHLEGALAQCRSDHARALTMAIVAMAQAEHACVLFASGVQETGVAFAAAETFVIASAPRPGIDFALSRRCTDGRTVLFVAIGDHDSEIMADRFKVVTNRIERDPFEVAAELLTQLRTIS